MRDNKVQLDFANDQVIINGVMTLAQKSGLDDTDGQLQYFCMTEKHCDERPLWLVGPQAATRVKDAEDSEEVQARPSLPADSPVLLIMEEEHKDTLQEGEKEDIEAPQPKTEQKNPSKCQVWDKPIQKPMWNWEINPQ